MSRILNRLAFAVAAPLTVITLAGCSAAPLDFPLLEISEAGSATEPGDELGIDDVAFLESSVNYAEGAQDYVTAVALRALEPRTADDWPDLVENPEDFADYTPVVLIVEQHIFGDVPEGYRPEPLDVFPVYADGEVAPYVVVDFAGGYVDSEATCGHTLYERDYFEAVFQYCLIGAAEEGEIVGMRFDGQRGNAFTVDESTPYWQDPVFWRN